MKKGEYYTIAILSSCIGAIVVSLFMAAITKKIDLGSVPDWLNLILVGGTISITWVIFQRQTSSHLKIAAGTRNIKSKCDDGGEIISTELELVLWVTNDGNAVGSFKFIGFVPDKIDKKFNQSDTENRVNQMQEIDPAMLFEEREFITLKPNTVSNNMVYPVAAIRNFFKKEIAGQEHCVINACWMDAVGKIYTKHIRF